MLIWQAVWDRDARLLLWAEQLSPNFELDEVRSGGEASRPHPYAVPNGALASELDRMFQLDGLEATEVTLFIPSHENGPLVQATGFQDNGFQDNGIDAHVKLAPWSIPVVVLPVLDAFAFLSSLPPTGDESYKLGDSLRYFRESTKFTLDLLTRGRFIPVLERRDEQMVAQWRVLLNTEEDRERYDVLERAMPGVVVSAFGESLEGGTALAHFLQSGVDGLLRVFVRRVPPFNIEQYFSDNSKGSAVRAAAIAWLRALVAPIGLFASTSPEMLKLETRLKKWSGAVQISRQSFELALSLRVITPTITPPAFAEGESDGEGDSQNKEVVAAPTESAPWTIEFHIQAKSDPDLTISAADLWAGRRGFLDSAGDTEDDLEAFFLRALGQAAQAFSPLKRALTELFPVSVQLSVEEIYQLLKVASKELIDLGVKLVLPAWWEKSQNQLGLSLHVNSEDNLASGARESLNYFTSEHLLDFSWRISLGEHELTEHEFEQLMVRQSPLVFLRGEWIEFDPNKLKATLKFLEDQKARKKLTLFEALHLGFGLDAQSQILPITRFEAEGWVKGLLEGSPRVIDLLDNPTGFTGELRPYQREGLTWMMFHADLGLGACLADDMGLGKTVQFLALLQQRMLRRKLTHTNDAEFKTSRPLLLVVPMSILANWEYESGRFTPDLSVYVHHGTQRLSQEAFLERVKNTDLVITTYSIVFRDEALIAKIEWDGIALDEAQNIKNLETKQTRAVRRLCYEQIALARGVRPFARFALTGTPLENRLDELWSIFDFLNPGFFGDLGTFRTKYAMPIEKQRDPEAAKALSALLKPFVLRRLKSDPTIVGDLPEKLEMNVVVPLTKEQAALYQSTIEDMFPQLETTSGIHRKGLVLATITRLKQICNHPTLFLKDGSNLHGRSHKISIVVELLETMLAEGDKALLFTQFAQFGHLLQPYLTERLGKEVLFLHGALSRKERDAQVARFQTSEGPPVFILSLKAGGFGLNLTEANQVIHLDQWWNPAVENQATDRVYRIGQRRNVQVRKLICQGTLEERIAELLQHKRELADQVVGSTKESITKMSTEDLRRLLDLGSYGQGVENDE